MTQPLAPNPAKPIVVIQVDLSMVQPLTEKPWLIVGTQPMTVYIVDDNGELRAAFITNDAAVEIRAAT